MKTKKKRKKNSRKNVVESVGNEEKTRTTKDLRGNEGVLEVAVDLLIPN